MGVRFPQRYLRDNRSIDRVKLTIANAAAMHSAMRPPPYGCQREYILRALDAHQWQVTETAAELGISRKNLWEKMRKIDIHSKPER